MTNVYGKCTVCEQPKAQIHRKVTVTDADGVIQDSAQYCERCWAGMKTTIQELELAV